MEATMIVPFIVSLFGHRQIEDWRQLDDQFTRLIKKLLQTKTCVSFMTASSFRIAYIVRTQKPLSRRETDG